MNHSRIESSKLRGVVVQGRTVDEAKPALYSDTGDAIQHKEIK